MAKQAKKEVEANDKPKAKSKPTSQKPKIPLKSYILKKDLPYDKGVKKKGTKVELSKGGFEVLRAKGIV